VSFGEVDYLRLEEVEKLTEADSEDLPFFKRVAFQPEQEYRIIVETSEAQEAIIGLELPLNWIGRILLNPWLPERVAQSVKQTLLEIGGCENLVVERSHMIENARWKRAGEVAVGLRPPKRTRNR
jgi:hypothetical protein